MKVIPIGDRVLVLPIKAESKTASGILLPETTKEKTDTGTVVAVGTDSERIKVSVGQKVMFDRYAGVPAKIDGEGHLLLKAQDIIAVVEE